MRRVRGFAYLRAFLAAAFAGCVFSADPALAIPSPELIVGSFASISQLFALASGILGGAAAYGSMRLRAKRGPEGMSRVLIALAIGLFIVLVASVGLNVYQYVEQKNDEQARIESTLLRPSRAPQGLPNDPDAKEITYGEQLRHPLRIGTEEVDKLLTAANRGEAGDYVFLDVREAAEQQMGSLQGVTVVRFPDLKKAGIDFTNKKAILFCHNGNRSSETCEALQKMGIDCRFMVGGLEKWIVEGRNMTGLNARSLSELRAVPDYPNRSTLLTTAAVKTLVDQEKATFVDIRHPADFQEAHIAGAINLSLRRMPTEELEARIAQLPKKPIILPCYDRRGCFFAEVLGHELTRAGHDVRGRYTLPWEYFVARPRPPHVEQWIAEQNKSLWSKAAETLAGAMSALASHTGTAAVIVLLATLSRILVLPFSVKAERDQIRARAVAAELDELKSRLKHDPSRRTRAVRSFYKRHGITPIRNLIALAFLPIMAVALLAVQEMASKTSGGVLWMPSLAQRDPLLILPVIFGALITLYVDLAFATTAKQRLAIWLTVFPTMIATGTLFGAAADIYLTTSATLLLLQRVWADGAFGRLWQAWRRSRLLQGVISLDDVELLANQGNKAYRLAQMRAAGMPVPEGLLLTPACTAMLAACTADERRRHLDRLWRDLGAQRVAVRSSAISEDGDTHSFAGVFESVVDVDRAGLDAAIATVTASFEAARTQSYGAQGGVGSVLVQRMVDADYAGVLFTRDPQASGLLMVELVQGTAENLVSGLVHPQTYRFGRATKAAFGEGQPPIDLRPLLELGEKAERLFGRPQDVEWTYRDGRFYLVQSRDITRTLTLAPETALVQDELARALDRSKDVPADEVIFGKNELSEMLPRPTPLSFSLMEALWASGGSIDLAARSLGLSYPVREDSAYLVTILGCLEIGTLAAWRLLRDADRFERAFREEFLPPFLRESRLAAAIDFDKLTRTELVAEIGRRHDRFVKETHVEVDVINVAAGFYLERARQALSAAGFNPSEFLGHIPTTHENHSIAKIAAAPADRRRRLLLRSFGHRSIHDYELAEPRYAEDVDTLARVIDCRAAAPMSSSEDLSTLGDSVAKLVGIARRFQTLKEDAKHHSLRELAVLRRALLALDRQLGFNSLIFHLSFQELAMLNEENASRMRELAVARKDASLQLRKAPSLPASLTAQDLEMLSAGDTAPERASTGSIRGTRVSGSKIVEGRAFLVADGDAENRQLLEGFRDGDIIVASMINPAWLPYFSRAGGFVCEVGGWLSHPAILAREYDVPMIVGTKGITGIHHGSVLRLHLDGLIETAADREALRVAAA
jgi:rhodanese-related sulfurtransferase/phosphohistidine swiveling domain-containing protein